MGYIARSAPVRCIVEYALSIGSGTIYKPVECAIIGGVACAPITMLLCRNRFFLDPEAWCDCRQLFRSPEFRHNESKVNLRQKSYHMATWVDELRIVARAGPTSNPTLLPAASRRPTASLTLSGFCEKGQLSEAVDSLSVLAETQSRVSNSQLYWVLKRCVAERNLVVGRRVHDLIVELGYESSAFLGNHLLRMYACHGRLEEAMHVFTKVGKPSPFMWCSMISAHAKHGKPDQAIQLYQQMRRSGVKPDGHVFVAALQACARAQDLGSGRQVHRDVLESGIPPDSFVCCSLVHMYVKCGRLEDARRLFDAMSTKNVVTWTAMIAGYAEHGLGEEALSLHARMEQDGLTLADSVTYICLLKACASFGALKQGKQLHSQISRSGKLETDVMVGNHLVDMYAKCGSVKDARRVFDSLVTRNVVTWTAMIAAYTEQGLGQEALALHAQMEQEHQIPANNYTFACLLKACAGVGALEQGRQLHSQILERRYLEGDIVVGNCLVDMYARCGRLEEACRVFHSLGSMKNAVTWTVLISGYGRSNQGHRAIACFEEMLIAGVLPNDTTFTCLLVACSQEGLVNEGRRYFHAMQGQHGLKPTMEHYTCMIDLLGRAGHLDEAENMLLSLASQNDCVGLLSLLTACRSHRDIERGTRCYESLVRRDPQHASAYVLMASMYADAGRWTDVDRIEKARKLAGACKKAAVAGIEVNRQVHSFVVGEVSHDLSCKVRSTIARMKEEGGHVPYTNAVLKLLSENDKEDELCGHAEKIALAYGLLNTPNGTPLLVTKNLRMCRDCHSSTEIMSRIEKRDIVVRDAYRLHRFEAGSCSCKGRP